MQPTSHDAATHAREAVTPLSQGDPLSEAAPRALGLLVVEDDDGDALLVEDQLAIDMPESVVIRARSIADARAELSESCACVLLDLHLPDANGLEAVAELRELAPSVPLIVLTGVDDSAIGVAALDAGAQDYLVKGSVGSGELARAIRYAIARAQVHGAERELVLARAQAHEVARLERGLAPRPILRGDAAWMSARHRAGRSRALLGGDFYDAVQSADGPLRLVIGDVCGHGSDEAAIGVCLRSSWRALALTGAPLEAMVRTMQRVFEQERHVAGLFTTLCMIDVDARGESAQILLAGHPPPALICGPAVERLPQERGCAPIGLGREDWRVEHVELPSDWVMLLYTDGIIEGRVGIGPERLGESGLHQMIAAHLAAGGDARSRPQELIGTLINRAEELNGGPLIDDVALMLVGSGAAPGA
ncbi:MAG TPA: SpoIIE family protein phosphatase [Solirubrobacteraceae bacterium]|nr:SpoIIE family protein phosphatase [Solirubrobacteraceae bacterium]